MAASEETTLTEADVTRLLENPSTDARLETARKLASHYEGEALSETEKRLAEDIFRVMVRDAEVRVREALSQHLKTNPSVPHDVAAALAQDVASVALPFLEFSSVLTADDLMQIVRSREPEKQIAVAKRATVTAEVAAELVKEGTVEVAATLAANQGAEIPEASMIEMVERFGDDERVQEPLVQRAQLPVTVTERLVHRVSEALREHILQKHELPADLAADLVLQSRERATIALSAESTEDEVEQLVRHMQENGRLTPSIVVRAAVMGDLKFVEYAIAVRGKIPIVNARVLIHDSGPLGLQGAYDRANLPRNLFPAVRAALDVARETDYDGGEYDRERYQRRMLERVLTQYGDLGVDFESSDLEYLLTKMGQLPAMHGGEG